MYAQAYDRPSQHRLHNDDTDAIMIKRYRQLSDISHVLSTIEVPSVVTRHVHFDRSYNDTELRVIFNCFGDQKEKVHCSIIYLDPLDNDGKNIVVVSDCLSQATDPREAFSMVVSLLLADVFYKYRRDDVRTPGSTICIEKTPMSASFARNHLQDLMEQQQAQSQLLNYLLSPLTETDKKVHAAVDCALDSILTNDAGAVEPVVHQ